MKEFLLSEVAFGWYGGSPCGGTWALWDLSTSAVPASLGSFLAGQARSPLVCHLLRIKNAARNRGRDTAPLRFSFRLQFASHAGICHIAVHWQYNEVLLFSDPAHVGLEDPQILRPWNIIARTFSLACALGKPR